MFPISWLGNKDCEAGSLRWTSYLLRWLRSFAEPKGRSAGVEFGKADEGSFGGDGGWRAGTQPGHVAVALMLISLNGVHAQTRLELNYTASVAGFSIADLTINGAIGESEYTVSSDGGIRGLSRMSGRSFYNGSHSVYGTVSEGSRLAPTKFSSKGFFLGQPQELTMTFEDGNVKEVSASKSSEIVTPLADEHRRSVLDPLTALLIPGDLTDEECKRTVRVFDGHQRYDLALAFRRMGKVKAKEGYDGPALVCSGRYKPIAGYRGSPFMPSFIVDYLTDREMEVVLAPISGTRILAPFRASLESMIGSMAVQATRFKAVIQ